LSPAVDLNPSFDKNGLALNIGKDNNMLDIKLAKSHGLLTDSSREKLNFTCKITESH
jgi:serine/threonine-protein kinase HipA